MSLYTPEDSVLDERNIVDDGPKLLTGIMTTDIDAQKMENAQDEETLEMLKHITILKSIITSDNNNKGLTESSDGMLYLSRFAFGASFMTKKKSTIQMSQEEVHELEDEEEKDRGHLDRAMSPASKEKKRQLSMALASLAMKPARRTKLIQDGALQTIIEMSQLPDPVVRRACAAAIASLSLNPESRGPMLDAGMLSTLIFLASCPSKGTRFDSCAALCNLCCHPGSEPKAIKEGILMVIQQVPHHCPEALDSCLKICINLAAVHEKYSRIEDITEALMHFHSMNPDDHAEELVLSAINNLSGLRANQFRLVEDGALKILSRTIESSDEHLRTLSADCVRNLSTCNRSRQKLIDNGFIATLVNLSEDSVDVVRRAAIQAFYHFAKDRTCREKVVLAGGLQMILRAARIRPDIAVGTLISKSLKAICADTSFHQDLVDSNVVEIIMNLLIVDSSMVKQYCVECLTHMFELPKIAVLLTQKGAIGILVSVCNSSDELVTGEWIAYCMYHIVLSDIAPSLILSNGILPSLIRLSGTYTTRTRRFCAAAISHITLKRQVDCSRAIPILVNMLQVETDHHTKSDCASALYNLADTHENCDQMLQADGLIPVVKLTQSDHLQTKIKCAAILSRLSQHEEYHNQFGADDVLRVLLDLSALDDTLTRRRVVIALSHLSQDRSIRNALLTLPETPHCIKTMISMPDEHMRHGCAAILCNLSAAEGSESQLIKAGVVPTLLVTALVTSDDNMTKKICLKALINLMVDTSSYKHMVKDGFIWGLSSLALIDDKEVTGLCAKALCNLSGNFAGDMINSAATVKTVLMMINRPHEELELLKNGTRILTNMLLKTTTAEDQFRLKAVQNMGNIANCVDDEISEMFVLCLCLVSQSDACRPLMVSEKLLARIKPQIFSDPRLGFAYLTMYRNIANEPTMRTHIIDADTVVRFLDICGKGDANLDEAVAAALYCVSCATDNLTKLVELRAIDVVSKIFHIDTYERSIDVLRYLVGVLYNMSTYSEVHAPLVSQGYVKLVCNMFEAAQKDDLSCRLLCQGICHLACGKVNTAMMVDDGATKILCFMAKNVKSLKHKIFHLEDIAMNAAAFRNLCCVIDNQKKMVQLGCIDAIVDISHYASHSHKESAKQALRNAASALKTMTYNKEVRELLVESEALDIILQDLEKEMQQERLPIKHALLRDLEAESWENGSRGSVKEGRSEKVKTLSIFTELLTATTDFELDVAQRVAPMEKLLVMIHLDEPPIESNVDDNTSVQISTTELSHFDEMRFHDIREFSKMVAKKESSISDISINELKTTKYDKGTYTEEYYSEDEEEAMGSRGDYLNLSTDGTIDSFIEKLRYGEEKSTLSDSNSNLMKDENHPNKVGNGGTSSVFDINNTKKKKIKSKKGNPKSFDKLVQAINYAKKHSDMTGSKKKNSNKIGDSGNDNMMEDVAKKWTKLSRY